MPIGGSRGTGSFAIASVALAFALVAAGCRGTEVDNGSAPEGTSARTGATAPATTAPGTTQPVGTTMAPTTTTTPVPPTSAAPTSTTTGGAAPSSTSVITVPYPQSSQSIPAGASAADKAWCAQAKPISVALLAIYSLTVSQLEDLVNQARALQASAPAPLQAPLGTLDEIGSRFLAAVKAGKYTISVEGIANFASQNLTADQQKGFVTAVGDINSWISRTC
ncbi:MAG: hypothetical protein HYX32_10625 [Actinobacteria bacterium]|nr:hypothetical protein [Actinomycetota bacterium]